MADAQKWVTEGGLPPINEQPPEYHYTRERGWTCIYKAEGRLAEIRAAAVTKILAGWSPVGYVSKSGGDMYQLTAESSLIDPVTGEVSTNLDALITSTWNILGNELEKDLWEKPSVSSILEKIRIAGGEAAGAHNVIQIRKAVDAFLTGQTTIVLTDFDYTEATASSTSQTFSLSVAQIRTLVQDLSNGTVTFAETIPIADMMASRGRGVEKFPVSQWVLEHTQTGSAYSSLRGVSANVNRIHSRNYMLNVQQVPTKKLDALPVGYYLKKTPTVTTEGDKTTVKTQWWWVEDFDAFIYGAVIES